MINSKSVAKRGRPKRKNSDEDVSSEEFVKKKVSSFSFRCLRKQYAFLRPPRRLQKARRRVLRKLW